MIGTQLRELMQENKITQAKVAEISGASPPAVKKWLDGDTKNIDTKYAIKLANFFHVNISWLVTGEGPKRGSNISVINNPYNASDQYVKIHESKVIFACGIGCEPTYEEIHEGSNALYKLSWFQARQINPEHCARFKVQGESMYPLICDGDYILVDLTDNKEIKPNKVYCIGVEGEMRVKRLLKTIKGGLLIKSDNPEFKDEELSAEEADRLVTIIGRVIERSGAQALL